MTNKLIPADAVEAPIELVPAANVASECHINRRTIGRWILDEKLSFPAPIEINKRLYFRRADLEAWKVSRAVASCRTGAR
jgi:predicted DNA-binding transcriptional regulator AlpA